MILIIAIIAAVLFGLDAVGVNSSRISLTAAGLCLLVVDLVLAGVLR